MDAFKAYDEIQRSMLNYESAIERAKHDLNKVSHMYWSSVIEKLRDATNCYTGDDEQLKSLAKDRLTHLFDLYDGAAAPGLYHELDSIINSLKSSRDI